MSHRWTRKQVDRFDRDWLTARMGHRWSEDGPTVCTDCGVKYSRVSDGRRCKKRRKPNRWRLHLERARLAAQYPNERRQPVNRTDPKWILRQITACEQDAKYRSEDHGKRRVEYPSDEAFWKFSRTARRYRRLMKAWWAAPTVDVSPPATEVDRDRWAGLFTRGRNRIIERARRTQQRSWMEGGTRYTIYPDARPRPIPSGDI